MARCGSEPEAVSEIPAPPTRIDTHVHFWDPARLAYPWLAGVPALNRAFLPSDYAAQAPMTDVAKLVFVECGCDPMSSLAEARWVAGLAAAEPRLRGIVARAAVERGAAVRETLAALAEIALVVGIRRNIESETDPEFCLAPEFIAGVRELSAYDYSFDLCVRHHQLPAVIELVRRCPEVRFVLDHCGKPAIRDRVLDPWREHIRQLAALPNAQCKISGLLTEADLAQWRAPDLRPVVDHVLESFGLERVMLGSDWPVLRLAADHERWCEALEHCLAGLAHEARARLDHRNAEAFYRL
jgi:L-fuconolactonase